MLVGNVHLVAGDAASVSQLLERLEAEGLKTRGNPDLFARTYRQFVIDDARELRDRASSRGIAGGKRIFIIATPSMTSEAQNALLKTLEEPPADALFFFVVPSPHTLLPTLRSRAHMLSLERPEKEEMVDTKEFLAALPAKRLDMLKPLLEKDADEKRDLGAMLAFLAALERRLEHNPEGLTSVYRARKYIGDRGALVRPLLEQVALLVPVQ